MEKNQSYKGLRVWQEAMSLVTMVYRETRNFPPEERYGLVSQMRRAAVSIPSNIAEGWGRLSPKQNLFFLKVANGSLLELETEILVAQNIQLLTTAVSDKLQEQLKTTGRLLGAFMKSIRQKLHSQAEPMTRV
jgi:four helix bundle protein